MKTVYIKRLDLFKGIEMVLCNNITNKNVGGTEFLEDNIDLFETRCEECSGEGTIDDEKRCGECDGNGYIQHEVYQFYICRLDDWQKEQLKSFGVALGYSEALDVDVLPIYDFGTSWDAFSYEKEVSDDYELGINETLKRETVY